MKRVGSGGLAAFLVLLPLAWAAGCGRISNTDAPLPPTLSGIAVSPTAVSLVVGGTQQLGVTGLFSDGSTGPVPGVGFASSASMVATVSPTGLVTGAAPGSATITASLSGMLATSVVTVAAPAPARGFFAGP